MEARYRKQADTEPAKRERHMANADTRSFVFAKQAEMRDCSRHSLGSQRATNAKGRLGHRYQLLSAVNFTFSLKHLRCFVRSGLIGGIFLGRRAGCGERQTFFHLNLSGGKPGPTLCESSLDVPDVPSVFACFLRRMRWLGPSLHRRGMAHIGGITRFVWFLGHRGDSLPDRAWGEFAVLAAVDALALS
jgi:hypothetical protein